MNTEQIHKKMDHIGATMSIACVIHCMALPFLVTILPLVGLGFFLDVTAERVFVVATILLGATSLCWGYTVHKSTKAIAVFVAASIMIISAIFVLPHGNGTEYAAHMSLVPHSHEASGGEAGLGLLLLAIGGGSLAMSHILNRKLCRTCKDCKGSI